MGPTSPRGRPAPPSNAAPRLSELSPARRRLVTLMQKACFGRIERLRVRGGEPVLDPPPRVVRRVKIGGHNKPRPQATVEDFALKEAWTEFFRGLEVMNDGVVLAIEIAHGLPLFYEFEQAIPV